MDAISEMLYAHMHKQWVLATAHSRMCVRVNVNVDFFTVFGWLSWIFSVSIIRQQVDDDSTRIAHIRLKRMVLWCSTYIRTRSFNCVIIPSGSSSSSSEKRETLILPSTSIYPLCIVLCCVFVGWNIKIKCEQKTYTEHTYSLSQTHTRAHISSVAVGAFVCVKKWRKQSSNCEGKQANKRVRKEEETHTIISTATKESDLKNFTFKVFFFFECVCAKFFSVFCGFWFFYFHFSLVFQKPPFLIGISDWKKVNWIIFRVVLYGIAPESER